MPYRFEELSVEIAVRVKLFGYDMDNMKARCWYESECLVACAGRDQDAIVTTQAGWQKLQSFLQNHRYAVKDAWFLKTQKYEGINSSIRRFGAQPKSLFINQYLN